MTLSASGTYLNANEPPSSLNTLPGRSPFAWNCLNANEPLSCLNTASGLSPFAWHPSPLPLVSRPGSFQIEEGYDYDFVDPLDPRFECPICHLCLKDPCQTECGHRFCRLCIQKWISRGMFNETEIDTETETETWAEFNDGWLLPSRGKWTVGSWKWEASVGNFVLALFCSGNPAAVDYHSAGGQWELKSGNWRVGSEVGWI